VSSAEDWAAWIARKLEAADQGQQPPPGSHSGQQPRTAQPAFAESQGNTEKRDNPAAPRTWPDPCPFPEHQGNSKRRGAGADESDPRKPTDPPWRGRTARRSSTTAAMRAFRDARQRRGWSLTRAAEETGVSRPHLSLLERGLRRPSESVAEDIIAAYRMTDAEADAVSAIAVPWAGRDSPYRTGEAPDEW
jgi:DNA-binding XRE family transcriptional regulator